MQSPGSAARSALNKREIIEEIAATEGKFVRTVRATVNAFFIPLRDSHVLSAGEFTTVFRSLEDIKNVHGKLHGVIQTAADDDNVASAISTIANEFAVAKSALLEIYTPFGKGHESALRALKAALTRAEVSRAIDGISSSDERVKGYQLEDLLSVPLLRLGSLRELLSSLVSLLSPADKGFVELTDAVNMLTHLLWGAAEGGFHSEKAAATSSSGSASKGAGALPSQTPGIVAGLRSPPSIPSSALSFALPSFSPSSSSAANAIADSNSFAALTSFSSSAPSGASTAAIVNAAMPTPLSGAPSDLIRGNITTESVLAAQAQADDAVKKLEELEREVGLKETELQLAQREVARVEAESTSRGKLEIAAEAALPPMEEALRRLQLEEAELVARMRNSEHRAVFEAFLHRKKELEAEEVSLSAKLAEHEEALAQVRNRLANPPASVLPSDLAKASLYVAWKRALAEREELLRHARARKHELLKDLKARHETQIVLLELERRSAVDGLKDAVANERSKVEEYKKELAALDKSIEGARNAMKSFRQEFEALRVQLLIDRMAKSTQVANLADRRHRLAKEAEAFKDAVEAARQRVAAEESAKWEARLAEEKEAGEKRVAEERKIVEQKLKKVSEAMNQKYEAGFRPLLKQAEERHVAELQRVVDLQRELESKEAELRSAHEQARALSAAVTTVSGGVTDDNGVVMGGFGPDGKYRDPTTGEVVPAWKLREFEDLKGAVCSMWEQLDVPPEDITAFLSEADLIAPFSPQVLEMYSDMYRRLTASESIQLPQPGPRSPYEQQQQQLRAVSPPAVPYSSGQPQRFNLQPAPNSSSSTSRSAQQSAAVSSGSRRPVSSVTPASSGPRKTEMASSAQRARDEQDASIAAYQAKQASKGGRAPSPRFR